MEDIFNEAANICGMAICPSRQQDQMVLIGTKNWEFFVEDSWALDE